MNKTGKTIVEGKLRIGSQDFELSTIEPGESRQFSFQSAQCRSCEYQIGLTLKNHRQTIGFIGFIQRGMDYHDTLSVEKEFLTLDSVRNVSGSMNSTSRGSQSKKLKWVSLK